MKVDELIKKLENKENLSVDQTKFLFNKIMNKEIDNKQISKILIELANKGENSDEIVFHVYRTFYVIFP